MDTIKIKNLLLLLLLLLSHVGLAHARSSGGGYACNDATVSLCSLDCPNNNRRAWATPQKSGVSWPCCPAGMDMVAPPTRNQGYRIHLKGVGQVVRLFTDCSRMPCFLNHLLFFLSSFFLYFLYLFF